MMEKDETRNPTKETPGRDVSNGYARGWDDACGAVLDKHCSTCEWDELCGWKFRDGRGYCDRWERERKGKEDEKYIDGSE